MADQEPLSKRLKSRFGIKQNIGAGIIVFVFLMLFSFLLDTVLGLTILPGGLDTTIRKVFFFVSPKLFDFPGFGLLILILVLYIVGFVARTRIAVVIIRKGAGSIPFIGAFLTSTIDIMENLGKLVPVEVEFASVLHKCWLREVRWETNLDTGERWLACYVVLLTMPNPSTGFVFRVLDPKQIVHKLDNSSADVLRHIVTGSSYNPEWLYRNFIPEDFLDKNPVPQKARKRYKKRK